MSLSTQAARAFRGTHTEGRPPEELRDLVSHVGAELELAPAERIIEWALAGDTAALRVIYDAGAAIGRALAHVANIINPETIVIGGPLTSLGDILLEPVRRGLARHAVPIIGETTGVCMSSLGDRAEALGAAAIVLAHPGLTPALASSA